MKKLPLSTILIFFFAVVYAVGAATRAGVPGMVFDQIRESLHITAAETSGISSAGVFGCMAFLGISGLLIYNMGSGILRAVGDSIRPLNFLILTSILNIFLDLFYILFLVY